MSWVQGIWVRSGRFVGTGCRRPRRAGADNGGRDAGMRARTFLKVIVVSVVVPGGVD